MTRRHCAMIVLSISLALPAGCANLSQGQCAEVDWYQIGLRDGHEGQGLERFEEHRIACDSHDIIPDASAYYRGRDVGLMQFCSPEQGFELGRSGRRYPNVCPPKLGDAFRRGYRRGYQIFMAENRLQPIDGEIQAKQDELDRAEDEDQRQQLRRQIRDLNDEDRDMERNLNGL